jgi:energy-coupling factor transporter transmembrane protein EcfT
MSAETIILIMLIVLFAGALPLWPHSRSWNYMPTGLMVLILAVFLMWSLSTERPLFRNSSPNIKTTVQDVGDDIRSTGRDVAASIRRTVE